MDQDAEVKAGITIRNQIVGDLQALQGRIHNWLDKYFPEFLTVFKDWSGKMALATLEHIPLPVQLNQTTPERVAEIWSTYGGVQRTSHKRIQRLQEAAGRSVGLTVGLQMAQREIATNIKRYKMLKEELHALEKQLEDLVLTLPGIAEMLTVPGVGMVTVIELYSELGDIKNFENPRQILKYAGLNLRESSSGKHKGQTRITKRGRAKLRALLFRTVMPLVRHNRAFKALHQYYTTRQENPLRKKQSLIVLCGKLVRVLHTVGQKQCPFDEERMIRDIPHLSLALGA
ncbi:transposase [Bacillus aryabhattai]|uniref:Transposase n=1 Tax=Priestia aryabhattai TaxID=412384 RepID=A0A7W3RI31_PRIAR|nr:transposase [Priestia aryabhattai]